MAPFGGWRMNVQGMVRIGPKSEEWLWGVLPTLILSGAPVSHLMGDDLTSSGRTGASIVTLAVFGGLYAFTGWSLWRDCAKAMRVASRDYLVWGLTAIALASLLWSGQPLTSAQKSIALLGTSAFGLLIAVRFTFAQQIRILGISLAIICGLSIAVALALPTYGLHGDDMQGAWRGVFSHKNDLGHMMSLAVIVFAVEATVPGAHRWPRVLGIALAFAVMVLSQSMTSCVSSLIILVCVIGWASAMRCGIRARDALFVLISVLLVGIVLMLSCGDYVDSLIDTMLDGVGRDRTLTGRSDLWDACMDKVELRPLLGYGFGTFWLGWSGPSADIWALIPWEPPNAHNGLMDLALQVGVVGLVLYLLGYLMACVRAAGVLVSSLSPYAIWPVAFLFYVAVGSVTESVLMSPNSLDWAYYVACVLTVAGVPGRRRAEFAGVVGDEPVNIGGGK